MKNIKQYILQIFNIDSEIKEELEFTSECNKTIKMVGFATNLTPEVIEIAKKTSVDLIITHHDAWTFLYGMKDYCRRKLDEYKINHLFAHLPLDAADFGTNQSFISKLGANSIEKCVNESGYYCGRIAEFETAIEFEELHNRIEQICDEKVFHWKNSNKKIKRIGVVTGAGVSTSYISEMNEMKCDAYITGEHTLYSIMYAQYIGINMFAASHTYTEIHGVESLAKILGDRFKLQVQQINEPHW